MLYPDQNVHCSHFGLMKSSGCLHWSISPDNWNSNMLPAPHDSTNVLWDEPFVPIAHCITNCGSMSYRKQIFFVSTLSQKKHLVNMCCGRPQLCLRVDLTFCTFCTKYPKTQKNAVIYNQITKAKVDICQKGALSKPWKTLTKNDSSKFQCPKFVSYEPKPAWSLTFLKKVAFLHPALFAVYRSAVGNDGSLGFFWFGRPTSSMVCLSFFSLWNLDCTLGQLNCPLANGRDAQTNEVFFARWY